MMKDKKKKVFWYKTKEERELGEMVDG